MAKLGRPNIDTRKKLQEEMDKLALAMASSLNKLRLKGSDQDEKVIDGFKVLTSYMGMLNRQPETNEGAAIDEFRNRLGQGAGRGGDGGGDSYADPDAEDDDADDDPGERPATVNGG